MMSNFRSGNFQEETKSWNMAKNYLDRLDKRCDERDTAAAGGLLLTWYRILRAIYRNIHFEIKKPGHEEAEEELNKLFARAFVALKNVNTDREDLSKIAVTDTEDLLDEIDMKLNDLMYNYGLIIPQNRKRNIEAEVVEGWFND